MSTVHQNKRQQCRLYAQGNCRFGDRCKFGHDAGQQSELAVASKGPSRRRGKKPTPPVADEVEKSPPNNNPGPKRGEIPCKAWKGGSCAKGAKCWFAHDSEVQANWLRRQAEAREAEERRQHEEEEKRKLQAEEVRRREEVRLRREERERARLAEEERIREVTRAREEARERARQARLAESEIQRKTREARMAEVAKEEAAMIIQQLVLGSLVTFGAGVEVRHLITGFESCTVQIKGLPLDARDEDIASIFLDQGMSAGRFQVIENKVTSDGKRVAKVVTDAEHGQAISIGLEDIDFRNEKLVFEVGTFNSPGGMGVSSPRDTDVLTISWRAPSARFVAGYLDMETAKQWMSTLDGRVHTGRRIKVQMNTPPSGRMISHYNPNSIMISNLDTSVDELTIRALAGPVITVKRMRQIGPGLDNAHVTASLRRQIERMSHGLTSFDDASDSRKKLDGITVVKARFESWDEASRVHQSLGDGVFPRSMGIKESVFWLNLPNPMQYILTIPTAQHSAQRSQWDALLGSIRDQKACNLIRMTDQRDVVRMRLTGQVKAAVGALKVRVESLAAGIKIDGWHPSLGFSKNQFVRSISEQTGGYLRADHRRKILKAYGKPEVIDAIRAMVEAELGRLASKEWTTVLQRQVVRYFVRDGVPSLKEMFGEDTVQFNAASRTVTVRGEEARHALKNLISQALEASTAPVPLVEDKSTTCPVCYDDVSNPLVLGCKHVYCTPCLHHYLTNAEESDKFPIICIGDESRCGVPIALPVIQRFLTPADFSRLLEVAFTSYITQHPQEVKYCRTPDCSQIYRATEGPRQAIQCPSCFSSICSSCHEDEHEGVTCAINKLNKEAENMSEEWIRGMKRCPRCSIPIEKSGGCNHMACRCGAHICWRCMGVFAADEIYEHMNTAHDGIYDEDIQNIQEPIDYAEQEEVLRQAREANRMAQARWDRAEELRRQQELEQAERMRAALARAEEATLARRREETRQRTEADEVRRWHETFARRQNEVGQEQARENQRPREEVYRIMEMQREQAREHQRRREEADRFMERREQERRQQERRQQEQRQEGGWGCTIM